MVHRPARLALGVAVSVIGLFIATASTAPATYIDLMGFPQLQAELGGSIPTGAGIPVTQVEAPGTAGGSNYFVNPALVNFSGKTITAQSLPATQSSHANNVGVNFYGNTASIAPGLSTISLYNANHWLGTGFLNTGQALAPLTTTSRVVSHSWVGNDGANTGQELRRLDFTVEEDDLIQVVGLPNAGANDYALFKDSYNGISVGVTNHAHKQTTIAVDAVYTAGRVAPTLVTPGFSYDNSGTATSWATPMVSAGAALLLQTGQNAALSNGTITNRTRTINNAEASEVVKALLMAGADRVIDNPRGSDLLDYAIDTNNNLDSRYGAGQMNIHNSYRILAAGEQDAESSILVRGWDYNPAFGGAGGSTNVASYFFTPHNDSQTLLTASLVWNLDVEIDSGNQIITTLFRNLDLLLYDIDTQTVVASSVSTNQNTENLWNTPMLVGHDYALIVINFGVAYQWDYALAWQIIPEPATGLATFAFAMLLLPRRRRS
jgi:hypothetical protein